MTLLDWQNGYAAFTYSQEAKHNLIEYVKRQEEHHKKQSAKEELVKLLEEHKRVFDEKCLE